MESSQEFDIILMNINQLPSKTCVVFVRNFLDYVLQKNIVFVGGNSISTFVIFFLGTNKPLVSSRRKVLLRQKHFSA